MARQKRRATSSSRKANRSKQPVFNVGQRVQVSGYGEGTVIAIESRRGGRYSDLWVKPDEDSVQEIGVRYQHNLVEPA